MASKQAREDGIQTGSGGWHPNRLGGMASKQARGDGIQTGSVNDFAWDMYKLLQ